MFFFLRVIVRRVLSAGGPVGGWTLERTGFSMSYDKNAFSVMLAFAGGVFSRLAASFWRVLAQEVFCIPISSCWNVT